jgi:hypothetical protein
MKTATVNNFNFVFCSETSMSVYQTTQRYFPKERNLKICSDDHELKSRYVGGSDMA